MTTDATALAAAIPRSRLIEQVRNAPFALVKLAPTYILLITIVSIIIFREPADYYVTVVAGGTKIQQLSYSRYGPSNIDSSPQIRWYKTPDAIYVQSHPRGHLWAFSTNRSEVVDWLLPQFEHPM